MVSYTASWQGCVRVELREVDGVDFARVTLETWRGQGAFPSITLYDGPVSGEGCGEEREQHKKMIDKLVGACRATRDFLDEDAPVGVEVYEVYKACDKALECVGLDERGG